MLDTARKTDFAVVAGSGGINVSETERRRERPFRRIGAVGSVSRKDDVCHETLGVVVVHGKLPIGTIPGVVPIVPDLTLHVVSGIGGEMVAVTERRGIFETGVDRADPPLVGDPMIEHELVLDRAHHRFLETAVRVIVVPAVLVALRAVLDRVGSVVIRAAGIELQP